MNESNYAENGKIKGNIGDSCIVTAESSAYAMTSISPAAQRALAEAAERRAKKPVKTPGPEHGGRDGLDPVRYGDWEVKGLAADF